MNVTVRAPATTANLGAGFDCAAVALDLWNEVVITDGGTPDRTHLGVRAYERIDPADGLKFEWFDRIPRERGLGSSAAVIALGLVAAAHVADRDPDPEWLLREGLPLEGHADNLAAALAGGACLTVGGHIHRVADSVPAVPLALVPESTVATAEARASLPEEIPLGDAVFSVGRAALLGAGLASGSAGGLRRRAERSSARALPGGERAAPRRGSGRPARRRSRRHHLRLRPDGDRLGGPAPRQGVLGRALQPVPRRRGALALDLRERS